MYTNMRNHNTRYSGNSFRSGRFSSGHRPVRKSSPSIHEYIKRATVKTQPIIQEAPAPIVEIDSLNLPLALKTAISRRGYTALTPIQAAAIPAIRTGKDVIGIANTGTGKTAAFLLPLIERILKDRTYRALIITPTRELALQIRDELRKFTSGMPIWSSFCIGQSSMYTQIQELRRGPHVVIGTPGRLKDLIERKALKLESFKMVVLDEADQMLDMGFIHDVKHIISFLPKERQSLFFSATLSPAINGLIQSFVQNPVTVSVKKHETVANIKQEVVTVDPTQKRSKLAELLKQDAFKKVMVFGRTKMGVENLSRALYSEGFKVAAIHGDKAQFQRQQAIRMFKEDVVQILVATDVAARGIDIEGITHVINYEVPDTYEDYIHRIGRTGRAENAGVALTFAAHVGEDQGRAPNNRFRSARPQSRSFGSRPSGNRPAYGRQNGTGRSYGRSSRPSYYRADRRG